MKKIYTIIIIQILCVSALLSAAEQNFFTEKYTETLNSWINDEIDLSQMMSNLSNLAAEIDRQPQNRETYYQKARISLLRGQIYYERKDKKLSIIELEECLKYAEKSNEIQIMSSTFGVMSMANSLLMVQKGLLFIIANFTLPQKQMEKALELDPVDYQALLVKAQFLCNAPPIFGGNIIEGINLLKTLSERADISNADKFYILQTLSDIYDGNDQKNEAAAACRQALKLFPGNKTCKTRLSDFAGL